jgi:hypothetical protein
MSEGKIIMTVVRDTGYFPPQGIFYRATVRIRLMVPMGPQKDISPIIQLQASSPEELENKIKELEEEYRKLVKENPEFVKKIRVSEDKEISA